MSASGSVDASGVALAFIEAACHVILHARGVYPPSTFERRKQFGVPVHVSRHPGITAMLSDTLSAAREAIASGVAKELHLVILDARGGVVEQYGFAVDAALEPAVPVTLDEATSLFGGALTKMALLATLVPPLDEAAMPDCFTLGVACSRPADGELGAGSSRVSREALSEGRAPAAASSSGVPSSAAPASELLWQPCAPSDPEAALMPGSASAAPPLVRALKVVQAGRVRVAVSWMTGS